MSRSLAVIALFTSSCAGPLLAQFAMTNKPATVRAMTYHNFTVTGVPSGSSVIWSVNGVVNGNSTIGTNSGARYNAPNFPPSPTTVTITATVNTDASLTDSATVEILNPFPNLASVNPPVLGQGSYAVTLNGWGFVPGAVVLMNGAVQNTAYVNATRLTIQVSIKKNLQDDTGFQVVNPNPGTITSNTLLVPPETKGGRAVVSESAARRFLEQAAWGPDAYSVGRVRSLGFDRWIDEQFEEPVSVYPDPALINLSNAPVQARFFSNAVHGRDQLRQRTAFALHKIWVVSGVDISSPPRLVPYLRIFPALAFENYRNIMRKVTLNPAMGEYLDMRNNVKANPTRGTLPNENYGREFLQLFTIGLYKLAPNGTRELDAGGAPLATYDQATIGEFSRVFTGWTYPVMPGATPRAFNPAYYEGDMVAWEANHDVGAKTLLNGAVVPAGLSADQDLNAALDNAFQHPNVGPFVGRNLIQQMVTSNPSPDYVARVSAAFADNGLGVRGDMKAVLKAILLDPEARAGDDAPAPTASGGHLKEPVLFFAQTLRGLNAMVNDSNSLAVRSNALGQNVFYPASVFSYFSPFFTAPNTGGLRGPEFQIHTRTSAIERANQINTLVYGSYGAGATVALTSWAALAATPSVLADELGKVFLSGQMPEALRTELLAAITGTTGTNLDKAKAGLYVILTSGYYSVKK